MKTLPFYWMGILLLISGAALAQAPQSFSYQAVATDDSGDELIEQTIGIRFSIRQSSPSGTLIWQEIHNTSTDEFGLFALSVGQGNPSGGSASSFDQVNWGQGPYFLGVEMDATGGSNYVSLGTTQLRSVPFALYTDKSGLADSASVAHVAQTAVHAEQADNATNAQHALLADQSETADFATNAGQAAVADSSSVAEMAYFAENAQLATNALNATNATNADMASFAQAAFIEIMDEDRDSVNEIQSLSFHGDELSLSQSNTIRLTDASIYYAPGSTWAFPQGVDGDQHLFIPDQYTVPTGKTFYITAAEESIDIPAYGAALTSPAQPILPANSSVDNCRCLGFLVDENAQITPVIIALSANGGSSYTIPSGSELVIKSGLGPETGLTLNNIPVNFFSGAQPHIVIPGGLTVRVDSNTDVVLTAYLK